MNKTDLRMELRGKLDSLNAQTIYIQATSQTPELIADLEEFRAVVRTLQRCEAMSESVGRFSLWDMDEDEIHSHSHNPVGGHIMPTPEMGRDSAGINLLRTLVREVELCACRVFPDDALNICHVLNRLSSALYILTYKYLPAGYDKFICFGAKT